MDEVPDDFKGSATTPVANHLFNAHENCTNLNEYNTTLFHHFTEKILVLSKRDRPDIQSAVSFINTRVKGPDIDEWKKFQRAIRYLNATVDLVLTIASDESGSIYWWVGSTFAFHHNMRSHTGVVLSMGRGALWATSTKQKLNTRSSTESELVEIDDVMHQII